MTMALLLARADEDYLTTLSNKGTLRRAQRELPDAGVVVEVDDARVRARFADGTETVVPENVGEARCSCPALGMCKHVLMALMAAREDGAGDNPPEAASAAVAPPAPSATATGEGDPSVASDGPSDAVVPDGASASEGDLSVLLSPSVKSLKTWAGAKIFREALFRLETAPSPEVRPGAVTRVVFPDGTTVRFLSGAGWDQAKCDCGAMDACVHKVDAWLRLYRNAHGGLPPEADSFSPSKADALDGEAVAFVADFVHRFFCTGLARAAADESQRFVQLAAFCHGHGLPNAERQARRVAGQLKLWERRSAAFDAVPLLRELCGLANGAQALLRGRVDADTVGRFREEYERIPAVVLHGVGCEGWETDSGHRGVTVFFYCPQRNVFWRLSRVMPVDRAESVERLYHRGGLWGAHLDAGILSRGTFSLAHGRLSRDGRLSASSESRVEGLEGAIHENTLPADVHVEDFSILPDRIWRDDDRRETEAILTGHVEGPVRFDPVYQDYRLLFRDAHGHGLMFRLRHRARRGRGLERWVENMNHLATREGTLKVFARVRRAEDGADAGRLVATPIALHTEERRINLGLDPFAPPKPSPPEPPNAGTSP